MTENPVVRSSFFEQMMHDAASALHNSDVTQTDDGNTALDSVDVRQTHRSTTGHAVPLSTDRAPAVCEQHSNVSNDASATSSTEQHRPVDSTTSAQQIIGLLVHYADLLLVCPVYETWSRSFGFPKSRIKIMLKFLPFSAPFFLFLTTFLFYLLSPFPLLLFLFSVPFLSCFCSICFSPYLFPFFFPGSQPT